MIGLSYISYTYQRPNLSLLDADRSLPLASVIGDDRLLVLWLGAWLGGFGPNPPPPPPPPPPPNPSPPPTCCPGFNAPPSGVLNRSGAVAWMMLRSRMISF